ncbi:hypothetical protein HLK59_08665 [Streptomyces sp. S3(2020)]|uniref:hypothetical protein n=1 Tax=Streptomyces sp. S3(2020) TaxID=2732044 RepID=UPI00148867E9|nr:hypothetical protein [Streptomyces sp. S3(2020)]NNN30437.1 hypothetical protein [Streptomyces sp. S3(2020)]
MVLNSVRATSVNDHTCAEQHGAEPAASTSPLRAHDAWTLPIEVLRDALDAEFFEDELFDDIQAVLISCDDLLFLATVPGLPEAERSHLLRFLFSEHISHSWAVVTLDSARTAKVSKTLGATEGPEDAPPDAHLRRVTDARRLYEGSQWAPLHGWRDDDEVITALRALITDSLDGTAEDIPEDVYPLPEGVGAAVTIGYDEQGEPHPLVWVRTDIPSGLRADLWGFCVALSASPDKAGAEPDENGVYYVGMERSPVTGPGLPLLAALTVQRVGRRPGDCDFALLDPVVQDAASQPEAA